MNEQVNLFSGEEYKYLILDGAKKSLNEKFIIPPFSVFDAKQGYWQSRKERWNKLGIKSELGRDAICVSMKQWTDEKRQQGDLQGNIIKSDTSIFDPVLCEICYRWFCVENGNILDPFAGGSVRGIVANVLGYNYIGIDLSEKQIQANYDNAKELQCDMTKLHWINDDSLNIDNHIKDETADLIFTCPPYYDLEVYSDKENDLSNMSFDEFKKSYTEILKKCFRKLKNNRFGVIVISDVRDKKGAYRGLLEITKNAICDENIVFYNDIVLLNQLTTACLRAEKFFTASRKMVRIHQNVLVFYKGNVKEIKNNFKEIIED